MPLLSEVIGKYIDLYDYTAYEKSGICPFHENHSLGSFMVNDKKNIWKCFACGASSKGNPKLSFLVQYLKITKDEAEIILKQKFFENIASENFNKIYTYKKQKERSLDIDLLDKVYYKVFTYAYLSKTDKEYLTERGITDFSYYCSFPLSQNTKAKIFNSIHDLLNENFFVPGFYFDEYRNEWKISYFKGIGIMIKNADKKLVGIQIRTNNKDLKNKIINNKKIPKYLWFTSSKEAKEEIKYSNACENTSPVEVIYPKKVMTQNKVVITEGHFKAERLANEGFISVSVSGVTHWRKVKDVLFKISKTFFINKVYIAFDADYIKNDGVYNCLVNLIHNLENNYNIYILRWDLKYGKGIDDLMQKKDYVKYLSIIPAKTEFNSFY